MKKTISITVDVDAVEIAKTKVDNVSSYLNDCLRSLAVHDSIDHTAQDLEEEIRTLQEKIRECALKQNIAQEAVKAIKATKDSEAKRLADDERLKRWKCGACNHINYMDSIRCVNCNLPTRNDPKSKEVMLELGGAL